MCIPILSPQKVSEGGQGRDELLHGVLQEGEGDVRHGVHDVRHLSGEGQRQHGVQPVQEHSGDNLAEPLIINHHSLLSLLVTTSVTSASKCVTR